VEVITHNIPRGHIRHALFDFDGTLSLIREGWRDVMIPLMVELLLQTPRHESEPELCALVADYVDRLTGRQTIYQMIRLGEEIEKRGGQAAAPLEYKKMYHARLWTRIEHRVVALKAGKVAPDALMVPGATAILHALRARGVACYLASGTDEPFVRDEAAALGIAPYFAGIYGAQDDYQNFSKKLVIERIIREHQLHGSEFVVFGDGFVEIKDAKAVGGSAVGVASNEATRTGINGWKRARLLQAGADIIVPDFRAHAALVGYLFAEN
jgi:phosphoglycolate phosphatase